MAAAIALWCRGASRQKSIFPAPSLSRCPMATLRRRIRLLAVLLALPLLTTAGEVKVISTIAAKSTLEELKPMFERSTPHRISITFGTAVPLKRRIEAGEAFDVAILTPP